MKLVLYPPTRKKGLHIHSSTVDSPSKLAQPFRLLCNLKLVSRLGLEMLQFRISHDRKPIIVYDPSGQCDFYYILDYCIQQILDYLRGPGHDSFLSCSWLAKILS